MSHGFGSNQSGSVFSLINPNYWLVELKSYLQIAHCCYVMFEFQAFVGYIKPQFDGTLLVLEKNKSHVRCSIHNAAAHCETLCPGQMNYVFLT